MDKFCSFFGHWEIEVTNELVDKLKELIERLIVAGSVNVFLFGGFGQFDELCYQIVSELKAKYSYIKRIFVVEKQKYEDKYWKSPNKINKKKYEEIVYYPLKFNGWSKSIYYRNCEMIDRSDYIVFYVTKTENSGAFKAYKYALLKKKNTILV